MKQSKHHAVAATPPRLEKPLAPKRPYVAAVERLAGSVPDMRALFNNFGHVRTISTDCAAGLCRQPLVGDQVQHALKFLQGSELSGALGLKSVELADGVLTPVPQLGAAITFRQELQANDGVRYPVRGGAVTVYMDDEGKIFNVNSTLRRGRRNVRMDGIVSKEQAIAAAKADLGDLEYGDNPTCDLVFSAHDGNIDPVYEIVLCANNPRKVVQVLVKAHGGAVVYKTNLLRSTARKDRNVFRHPFAPGDAGAHHNRGKKRAASGAPAKAKVLLRIPDPNRPIEQQVHDALIESLPDPKELRNHRFIMYVGKDRKPVKAKPDGTYNYRPADPEFGAVITFFALNKQFELMEKWGMKPQERPTPVIVDDSSVIDNAYFDPRDYEIHIGIGSGPPFGLNRHIVFSLGVSWHEAGHLIVYLQAPGKDLPGLEGAAEHEATGDALGTLVMGWYFRLIFAEQLGQALSVADVEADPRIIGTYALPPNGLRKAKNTKRTPEDKTGEEHDDGEISGGAKSDLLVDLISRNGIEKGLELFARLHLAALALVPAHRVTFVDVLNAFVTADQRLNGGANRPAIIKAFGDHGITLGGTGSGRRLPLIAAIG